MYAKTIISYIKRKQLVQQKELSDIKESEIYLNKIVSRLSLIKEDGKKPDMEWDFTKTNLDKSKRWVKTKEDVKKYLLLLFDKLKNLPRKTKIKIILDFFSPINSRIRASIPMAMYSSPAITT